MPNNYQYVDSEKGQIILYKTESGNIYIDVLVDNDTVWLSQEQMGVLFDRDRTVINKHIRNIFSEGELKEEVVCANFAHTTQHGAITGKSQTTNTKHYNLDVIISVILCICFSLGLIVPLQPKIRTKIVAEIGIEIGTEINKFKK